jgi:GMP synthase-like glutamine amidotransferase
VRAQVLKHVDYEGLGSIEAWLSSSSAQISITELYRETRLPRLVDFDWLVVMGGPMSVNDSHLHPWLAPERELIAAAISSGKVVLGICLGAQLIASALGAEVYANREPEVGWHEIELLGAGPAAYALAGLPRSLAAFHWHEDTFDLPPKASRLARSRGCENQAFAVGRRVLGLQFHLEVTPETAGALIENSQLHAKPGAFIQSPSDMLSDKSRFAVVNRAMAAVLENLANPAL